MAGDVRADRVRFIGCAIPYAEAIEGELIRRGIVDREAATGREFCLVLPDTERGWQQLTDECEDDDVVAIAVLSGLIVEDYSRALSIGVGGVVNTFLTTGMTVSVLAAAADGEVRLPRQAAQAIASTARGRQVAASALEPSEIDMLRSLAAGTSVVDLARQRFYNERTVRRHLQNVYLKLGVQGRVEAIARASALGLLD